MLELMTKTNVHPYIYMTKYALRHFIEHAGEHNHRTALTYVSSTAAWMDGKFFGPYCGTKTHNLVLANLVRNYIKKNETT